jgi:hypothetical protein
MTRIERCASHDVCFIYFSTFYVRRIKADFDTRSLKLSGMKRISVVSIGRFLTGEDERKRRAEKCSVC